MQINFMIIKFVIISYFFPHTHAHISVIHFSSVVYDRATCNHFYEIYVCALRASFYLSYSSVSCSKIRYASAVCVNHVHGFLFMCRSASVSAII